MFAKHSSSTKLTLPSAMHAPVALILFLPSLMSPLPYVNNRWHAALAYQDRSRSQSAVDANPGVEITILSEDETRGRRSRREVNVDDEEREREGGRGHTKWLGTDRQARETISLACRVFGVRDILKVGNGNGASD